MRRSGPVRIRSTRLTRVRTLGAVCVGVLAIVLLAGCAQSEGPNAAPAQKPQAGPTAAQLADLRSTPASEALGGPRVPGLFSLEDARKLTGLDSIRIVAQTG